MAIFALNVDPSPPQKSLRWDDRPASRPRRLKLFVEPPIIHGRAGLVARTRKASMQPNRTSGVTAPASPAISKPNLAQTYKLENHCMERRKR
jgi:hypothetical protein